MLLEALVVVDLMTAAANIATSPTAITATRSYQPVEIVSDITTQDVITGLHRFSYYASGTDPSDAVGMTHVIANVQDQGYARAEQIADIKAKAFTYLCALVNDGEIDFEAAEALSNNVFVMVDGIPPSLDLPKPLKLSDGISLFWKNNNIYAELVMDVDGDVSAFARKSDGEEYVFDESFEKMQVDGVLFPDDLAKFMI